MDVVIARRIEHGVERGASALFAGAAAYCTDAVLGPVTTEPILGAGCVGAAVLAYLLSLRALVAIGAGEPRHPVAVFDLRKIDPMSSGELILTDADRLRAGPADDPTTDADVLVLDEIVADLDADSRVVRLFDREAMPTPGQLKGQIDEHLAAPAVRDGIGDASQALSDALSELRRSLR